MADERRCAEDTVVVEGAENERVGGDVFSRVWRGRAAEHARTRSYPPRTPESGPGGAQGARGRFALVTRPRAFL